VRQFRVVAFVLCAPLLPAVDVQLRTLDQSVIEQRFGRIQSKLDARADVLRSLFAEAGCATESWDEQRVSGAKLPNLICTLHGSTDRQVVVTAHYDKVSLGQGAIDNWSGASLLASLYESLTAAPRNLTFVFVLTTDEEKGEVGARYFVTHLTKEQRSHVAANVNIDSIGLAGPTYVWASRADPQLSADAVAVAKTLGIPLGAMNVDNVGDSDSHPFVDKKIPVIDFHSLTSATLPILHSKKDEPAALDPVSYYNTYRLLSAFLAFLDAKAN